jgi:hypothetical protein
MFKELQSQLSNSIDFVFPTETKIFVLGELIKLAEKSGLTDTLSTEIQNAQKTKLSRLSLEFIRLRRIHTVGDGFIV